MRVTEYKNLLNNIYSESILQHSAVDSILYSRMQQAYGNLRAAEMAGATKLTDDAFLKSFLLVRSHVQQAIKDGLRSFRYRMQSTDIDKLSCLVALLDRNFSDKKSLDLIIEMANGIFNHHSTRN